MPDIKETKEAVSSILEFASAIDAALANGYQWTDLFTLIQPMVNLPKAIDGAEKIPNEYLDLDQDEKKELNDLVETLDMRSDLTEKLCEQSFRVLNELGQLLLLVRKAKK